MENFYELSLRRQSCRAFEPGRAVEHDKLVKMIEAGRNAPSGCNAQPWSFVVVEDRDLLPKVAKCAQATGNEFTDDAGAFVIIMEEHARLMPKLRAMLDSQYFAKGDIGAAAAYVCLEAAELGLGTCQIGMFDRETLCALLGIPEGKRFGALIAVGYPKDPAIREKKRKPLDEIVRFV